MPGMIAAVTMLSILGLNIVGNKLREYQISKIQANLDLQHAKDQNKANQDQIRANIIQLVQKKDKAKAEAAEAKFAQATLAAQKGNLEESKKLTQQAHAIIGYGDTQVNQQFELLEGFQLQADTLALQSSNLLGLAGA